MEYRRVGHTDISVSTISLGTWALGGPSFSEDGHASGWSLVHEQNADADISVTGRLYKDAITFVKFKGNFILKAN